LRVSPGQFDELFYGGTEEHPWTEDLIGFTHLCFQVDDINDSVQRIRDAGYPIDSEPKQGVDRNWQAWVRDPNGIRIELMQIMPDSPQSLFR
ncbi:MAG: VOC family protein, partial [Oscillospiraceae bacterium]|nr:VOC family protein [Oscillospiraceae bacterium]